MAEAGGEGGKPKRAHKTRVTGVKAKKKRDKEGKVERHNPKAFSFSGGIKSVQKRVQYTLDKKANKERAPKTDKTPDVPPPYVVLVQGPPGVGKTTLVRSLVRHYCKQRLLQLRGPITLVSGRQRRLTIIECPQDMPSMLDLAKVADLVLVLIDASFGFELETFEFINILQTHGFPRVMGVLTHLDGFSENKQLRKVKKTMKHRFWTEVYEGAKLFYLSGMQNGRYNRIEVQNLARFIAVQKSTILSWRQTHPYMLALRWEDQTPPQLAPEAPRTLDLYGYVCGGRLREGMQAHLAGIGDFQIEELKALPDPCPLPAEIEKERLKDKPGLQDAKPKKKNALRTLAERHRAVYAPGSDVGSITVDADAMYISLPEHKVGFTAQDDEGELPEAVSLVRELQSGSGAPLEGDVIRRRPLRLMQGGATVEPVVESDLVVGGSSASKPSRRRVPVAGGAVAISGGGAGRDGEGSGGSEDGGDEADSEGPESEDEGEGEDGDEGEEEELDDVDSDEEHRQQVIDRAKKRFERGPRLEDVIYGNAGVGALAAGADAEVNGSSDAAGGPTDHKTISLFDDDAADDDDGGGITATAASNGVEPGRAKAARASNLLGNTGNVDGMDSVRMPVLPGSGGEWDEEKKESVKSRKFITGGWSSADEDSQEENGKAPITKPKRFAEGPKKKKSEGADAGSDASQEENEGGDDDGAEAAEGDTPNPDDAILGTDGFTDGVAISTFVRVRLQNVPAACVAEIRRERPLLLGGLLPGESMMGLVQMRIKRHRWHPKLLKSGDAMLLSVGWRRYQSVPTFSLEDRGEKRMRMLKYTLEHAHCTMTCYGPLVPPNTGVMAFRSFNKVTHFRVAGTGNTLESAADFEIKKKLKLVGEPYKIFKNTAFIKNMFTSDLEVSKYLHAKIQTISGIRGEVKKPEGNRGCFRATFEDRILMSDLVICKCWINVEPKKFYHPIVDVANWRPAKLIGELRANKGIAIPDKKDSHYGAQNIRPERKFNSLRVPRALQKALPFKSKPKHEGKKSKNKMRKKTVVVSSEREKQINGLLNRLNTVRKEKMRIRQVGSVRRKAKKAVQEDFVQQKRDAVTAECRKKRYIKEGQQETTKRKRMKLD